MAHEWEAEDYNEIEEEEEATVSNNGIIGNCTEYGNYERNNK